MFKDEKQLLVKQEKRFILFAKNILRNLVIIEFDQRINIMQNKIIKNVITTIKDLIQIKFKKINLSQLLSFISIIKKIEIVANAFLLFALSSLLTKLRIKKIEFFDSKY